MTDQRFDVAVFDIATRTVDHMAGTDMSHDRADTRSITAYERLNDRYDVKLVPAGKYQKGDVLPE